MGREEGSEQALSSLLKKSATLARGHKQYIRQDLGPFVTAGVFYSFDGYKLARLSS